MDLSGCSGECATLYLTDSSGNDHEMKGSSIKMKIKDVVKARVVGQGCFLIYKSKNFKSSNFQVDDTEEHNLKAKGTTFTTIKSYEYSADCSFTRRAGAEVYVLVAVVALVVLVAMSAVAWAKLRRRGLAQVPTEEGGTTA